MNKKLLNLLITSFSEQVAGGSERQHVILENFCTTEGLRVDEILGRTNETLIKIL